ncbi:MULTISPECIES: XisI protein [Spirulina sp. CCY15215]|uniref:XisI protein n=1 Tax=Spirulina sp. CCY15215 TaxID=2767591 RepID=UPI0019509623|nr:XisI protein [Spirulina major]
MDPLDQYRQCIEQILTEHANISTTTDTVKAQLIFDRDRDHYQLSFVGWQGDKRVFGPVMHFDIEDGKIWIQYNGTEAAVGERLVEMGVPASDIVLGFHSAFKRQFTRYAVG